MAREAKGLIDIMVGISFFLNVQELTWRSKEGLQGGCRGPGRTGTEDSLNGRR
jgi:hypothetical protein